MKQIILLSFFAITLFSCEFIKLQEEVNSTFADQHFKTAIAHIELYNIRYGYYPKTLNELTFIGEWDKAIFQSIDYEKLNSGYRLDIVQGIIKGIPTDLQ